MHRIKGHIPPIPERPNPKRWTDRGLYAAWLGHTTVLLKMDGLTILTDPVLGSRVGVNFGPLTVGLKRMVPPAMTVDQLPPIDLVLLSHAHMDHFDRATLRALENRGTTVVTASKTSDLLRVGQWGRVRELGWGERARVGDIRLRAFEVNHWGARVRTDTYRGYNGYVIDAGRYRVLFGGDTANTTAFRALRTSRRMDLAIMPVGAYNPWIHYHCNPEQAWQMGNDAGSDYFLPVHHQTFLLSREPFYEPIERLYEAAGKEPERIAIQRIGQEVKL
jgi:L-ascorbate metabolism protein UlaG (beta-lactamase superfamily)